MAEPFQPKFVDLVRNFTTTTGTGNFSLGPAVNGYTGFAAACQVGDSFYYSAIGVDKPAEREVGRGTLLAGGAISRDPIGGTRTNFTSGTKSIALIAAAEWFESAQRLVASVSPLGQALVSASSAATARSSLALGSASLVDSDSDIALAADSDSRVPTQKAIKAYVDAHSATDALLSANNLSDLTNPASARANLALGSAAVESVGKFAATVANRAGLAAFATTAPVYLSELGREGMFTFDAANRSADITRDPQQGVFVAPSSDATGASGAWVRRFTGPVSVKWFGAKGDGVTDDYAAIQAALEFYAATGGAVYVPASPTVYNVSARLVIKATTHFFGDMHIQASNASGPLPAGEYGSVLWFTGNVPGLLVKYINDSDTTGDPAIYPTGNGSIIERLRFWSAANGAYLAGAYGIESRVKLTLRNVYVRQFGDHGFCIRGSTSTGDGVVFGNVNGSVIEACTAIQNGGDGFYLSGNDANVCLVSGCFSQLNKQWSFTDDSLIGCTFVSCIHEGSVVGGYRCLRTAAASTFLGCETEGGANSFNGAVVVKGGNLEIGSGVAGVFYSGAIVRSGSVIQFNNATNTIAYSVSNDGTNVLFGGPIKTSGNLTANANLTCGQGAGNAHTIYGSVSFYNGGARIRQGGTLQLNAVGEGAWNSLSHDGTNVYCDGPLKLNGGLKSASPTGGIGYTAGAGGAVTQLTSKATDVTLNKVCGQITMNGAALAAAAAVIFTVTNSVVTATDTINLNLVSGQTTAGTYRYWVEKVAAGSFQVSIENRSAGSLSEALVLNFAVVKASSA